MRLVLPRRFFIDFKKMIGYNYYTKRNIEVSLLRDYQSGGALTEVSLCILLSLYQPRHGYAIMQHLHEKSNGRLLLGAGTLYGALTTLEKKKWIRVVASDERKKCYQITDLGRSVVRSEKQRLESLLQWIACDAEEERIPEEGGNPDE